MSFLTLVVQTSPNTFLGYLAGVSTQSSTSPLLGAGNVAMGEQALRYLQTGNYNVAIGLNAALNITTGNGNTALGTSALSVNLVGSRNTAVGLNAMQYGYSDDNTAIGYNALSFNAAQFNVAVGGQSLNQNGAGTQNTAVGHGSSQANTNGNYNAAFGYNALNAATTGSFNTAIGYGSGRNITTGSKNSILGFYSGNQGGLDIRTLSNYIVLSDGDGNPRLWIDNTGAASIPGGITLSGGTANGVLYLNASNVVTSGTRLTFDGTGTMRIGGGLGGYIQGNTAERLAAEDGTGFFYGWGGGVNPAVPLNIGNTGTTDFIARAAAAAQFRWLLGAGEQMRLNSTGLGIGTNNPSYKLDVVGSVSTAKLGKLAVKDDSPFITGANIDALGSNLALGSTGANFISFFTNNLDRMRLDSAGNLGIGTINPVAKLHVNTGGNTTAGGILLQNAGNQQHFWYLSSNTVSAFEIGSSNGQWTWTNSNGERMRLDAAGNLGLGVTPSAWESTYRAFSLASFGGASIAGRTSTSAILLTSNAFRNTSGNWVYASTGPLPAARYEILDGAHQWFNAASGTAGNTISFTQAMTLDAGGRLLIGYTSSTDGAAGNVQLAGPLVVGGALTSNQTNRAVLQYSGGNEATLRAFGSSAGSGFLTFWTGGGGGSGDSERMRIDANGNVVINTAAINTNATNGFLYVPSCAGVPTGVPTTYTGRIPMVVDSTNNHVYFYIGGNWRYANTI